jgi:hypothetical protein
MSLPENFNEWEHLQDQVRRIHNEEVREWFSNAPDLDISTPRASLKHACLIKDDDSVGMVQLRQWLFEVQAKHAKSLQPDIYGLPVTTFQTQVEFKPQVQLYFMESLRDVESGYSPVEAEISFRLTESQYQQDVSPAEAKILANKIRSAMATPLFTWAKGRILCTYKDSDRGYNFQLYTTNEAEGKRVIEQVLDIRSHSPDWDYLVVHESKRNFPIVPPTKTVYGKSRRQPRKRPRANVRFRYATLHLYGLQNPVNLVDTTGFRHKPLVKV